MSHDWLMRLRWIYFPLRLHIPATLIGIKRTILQEGYFIRIDKNKRRQVKEDAEDCVTL